MSEVIELKYMIHRVLLPRIRQLEEEVATLRKHTWPYVQAQKEHHQLDDINAKMNFFKNLDDDTIKELLSIKSMFSANPNMELMEYDTITHRNLQNNFC
jgi:hypothetical protein